MSNQPASDRALRGALSLPGINAGASRAIRVNLTSVFDSLKRGAAVEPVIVRMASPAPGCAMTA